MMDNIEALGAMIHRQEMAKRYGVQPLSVPRLNAVLLNYIDGKEWAVTIMCDDQTKLAALQDKGRELVRAMRGY